MILGCSHVTAEKNFDDYFMNITDKQLNADLSEMENYYYGHDYEDEGLKKRLNRLEKTIFRYKRGGLPQQRRFEEIYRLYKTKKSPFYINDHNKDALTNSQMSLLALMENRIFGKEKPYQSTDERLSELEMAILGTSIAGTIQERFDYLSKNTPISVKGVRVSQNGQTIAAFKPGYKQAPVPASPYQKQFTPLEIQYDQAAGDYFKKVAKNSTGEILRWKDFPVYIYINSNDNDEITLSRLAINYWQGKVPLQQTSNYQTANILIDWASQGEFITVPIISRNGEKKDIKILINMLGPKKSEPKSELLVFLMHQMGHALGVWGHSDNPTDLMYPIGRAGINDINTKNRETYFYEPIVLQSRRPEITKRDLNTIYRVYQTPTSIEKILAIW